jgi:hypothetical protein
MFLFLGYIFGAGLSGFEEMEHFILWTTVLIAGSFYGYYVIYSLRGGRNKCDESSNL